MMKDLIKIKTKYQELSKDVIDYEKFNHYGIVHHGSSIEGSTLSLEETYLLLDENLTPNSKPLPHTLMTIDHYKALKYVLEIAEKKEKLTINIIREISSMILKNTGSKISTMAGDFDSSKGEFRKTMVRAGSRTFMNYKKVPEQVEQLINTIKGQIDKLGKFEEIYKFAFDAHFQMVSIHPFADGNGRLSRLLMNYIQHYHKEPLTIVYKEDKIDYYQALEDTRNKQDIVVFERFMFNQAEKFFADEISNLTKKQVNKSNSQGFSFLF